MRSIVDMKALTFTDALTWTHIHVHILFHIKTLTEVSREHGNELTSYIIRGVFLTWLSNC
jgi:hypothetical protein